MLLLKFRLETEAVRVMIDFPNRSGILILVVDEPIFRNALELLIEVPERLSLCDEVSVVLIKELNIRTLVLLDLRSFSGLWLTSSGRGIMSA